MIINSKILGINIRPEMELLLKCGSTYIDDEKALAIKSLVKQDLDWHYLIKSACYHGLIPLLYTNLKANAKDFVPEAAFKQLYSLFLSNTRHNLLLTGELVKILRLLQENGISAVPYKGPVLATSLYDNIALRQFGDLDIIVQQLDVLKVKKVLVANGYRPKVEFTETEEAVYLKSKSEHTYDFVDEQKGILIEVHWRITPKYTSPIEPKHFWNKLELCRFASINIYNLPLKDWLLILCVHGSRHHWEKLSWFCDIAQLIRAEPDIDWEIIIHQASEFDCKRMLFIGLFLAHHLTGVLLPAELLDKIEADKKVVTLALEICQEIFSEVNTSQRILSKTTYHIRVREQLQNKVLYFESFLRWLISPKKQLESR